jgi:hypothetical protein
VGRLRRTIAGSEGSLEEPLRAEDDCYRPKGFGSCNQFSCGQNQPAGFGRTVSKLLRSPCTFAPLHPGTLAPSLLIRFVPILFPLTLRNINGRQRVKEVM